MTHTFIYLLGFAGVGKYTVAKAIQERVEVHILDNHYILNPIFSLIEQGGITPLPAEIWGLAGRVHEAPSSFLARKTFECQKERALAGRVND